ncbi:hypothetical protein ACFL1N_14840 [Thermodesulfobacteriota bacterium]
MLFRTKTSSKKIKRTLRITHKTAAAALFCMFLFYAANSFSIEFMTSDDFLRDESRFKDFPIKLLFKKLADPDESEKSAIRNYIILKQVFSTDEKNIFDYQESFGMIKDINNKMLSLWLPSTNELKELFLGIDMIPAEIPGSYKVMESNIGEFGCIVYSLDDRVYMIKILFHIKAPGNLQVNREGDNNIVNWSGMSDDFRPSEYKVFRNGEFYKTVKDTSLIIPRKKSVIDNYYVKSVYGYNNATVESNPSKTVFDEITANEQQKELAAGDIYGNIIAAIKENKIDRAKTILSDEKELLYAYLDEEKKVDINILSRFFNYIDEGDRILSDRSEGIDAIERAVSVYKSALGLEENLPQAATLVSLAESKIEQSIELKKILEGRNREQFAADIYEKIIESINPEDYEKARKLLADNEALLDSSLDDEKKARVSLLKDIFDDIDEGDKYVIDQPDLRSINMALRSYEKAAQTAEKLQPGINIASITDLKIKAGLERKDILEQQISKNSAEETYQKILSFLTPLEWEKGKSLILEENEVLSQHLNPQKMETINSLKSMFDLVDEGDRQRSMSPETKENLDAALKYYSQAGEFADGVSGTADVRFIPDQKIREGLERKKQLETSNRRNLARERYDEIIGLLSPEDWKRGKELLSQHRLFLMDHLDAFLRDNTERLTDFFDDIDSGDTSLNRRPLTTGNVENAFSFYRKAEQRVNDLPDGVNLKFITDDKIAVCQENRRRLEERSRKEEELAAVKSRADQAPVTAPQDSGVTIVTSDDTPLSKEEVAKMARSALEYFDEYDYEKSWDYFSTAYRKPIARIQRGGNNRIMGVLALPSRYRAEIFFLIEYEKIKKDKGSDEITRGDLEEIRDDVNSESGLWVMIKDETKKKKIRRHIARFGRN